MATDRSNPDTAPVIDPETSPLRIKASVGWERNNSLAMVGLDSNFARIPKVVKDTVARTIEPGTPAFIEEVMVQFNMAIVRATADLVCGYKPQSAFYEPHRAAGANALDRTVAFIHQEYGHLVILDAKRGDIESTNDGYVQAHFKDPDDISGVDAMTMNGYLGDGSLDPFLNRADKGCIVLVKTSNRGSATLQDKNLFLDEKDLDELFKGGRARQVERPQELAFQLQGYTYPVFKYMAQRVANHWNVNGNCAVVVGSTYPLHVGEVREIIGDMPILLPGTGDQAGDLEKSVRSGVDSKGQGLWVNVARSAIFASSGEDFAQATRAYVSALRDEINGYRS